MCNKSTEFTYVSLWTAFSILKSMYDSLHADPRKKDQALALRLAALTIAFFSLEAFLNHLIQAIKPDVWHNETDHFNRCKPIGSTIYRGALGKLQFVHDLCSQPYDEGSAPISVAKALKAMRDTMAHARTYQDQPPDMPASTYPPPPPTPRIFAFATHDLLVRSAEHIEQLRLILFEHASRRFPDADLGPRPDTGISMSQRIRVV